MSRFTANALGRSPSAPQAQAVLRIVLPADLALALRGHEDVVVAGIRHAAIDAGLVERGPGGPLSGRTGKWRRVDRPDPSKGTTADGKVRRRRPAAPPPGGWKCCGETFTSPQALSGHTRREHPKGDTPPRSVGAGR